MIGRDRFFVMTLEASAFNISKMEHLVDQHREMSYGYGRNLVHLEGDECSALLFIEQGIVTK